MRKMPGIEGRTAVCMAVLFVLIFVSILRVAVVATDSEYSAAATNQSSYKLTVKRQRGTIFDTNMIPLTNREEQIIAAVTPAYGAIDEVRDYLYEETPAALAHRLAEGKPVLVRLTEEINGEHVRSVRVLKNGSMSLATHLLGYLNSSGHGVSGVEAAFDSVLYSEKSVSFLYTETAAGELVEGGEIEVLKDSSVESSGIKLTIDSRIQAAVENAAEGLQSGAVVVGEIGTGKIRALASFPDFDAKNIAEYLSDERSPLINRAFCAYNVGSVFKPCVAAAALEDGTYGDMLYECVGHKNIAGKNFACHYSEGHGKTDIGGALKESCNTFFYTLAINLGAEKIYDMASSLGFGTRYSFGEGLYADEGVLPSAQESNLSEQSLANLSIGQGSLLLAPVSLLPLYEAIGNGGVYHRPTLIEGIVENGASREYEENYPTRVMSEQTANQLKQALFEVINSGTGASAKPKLCAAAGKTATAQTGWIKDGEAVDHSWLCGFFPADNPLYTVVIISENTSGGGTPCGPVFSAVCDAIYSLNLS